MITLYDIYSTTLTVCLYKYFDFKNAGTTTITYLNMSINTLYMLDSKDMQDMEQYIKKEDAAREELISRARVVLKNSKSAIYSIHRKEYATANKYIKESAKILKDLKNIVTIYPHLKYHIDNSYEEYAEAAMFHGFVVDNKIPSSKSLDLGPFNYLAGLSDLTGELARKAVIEATAKNKKEVQRIRDVIDEIFGIFIRFDLRNGDLRKKSDAIKWNLNKVEELLYDLNRKS
jgi:translin